MPRKPKSDPELNLVSFCDIVTVTCVALFMAMIVVLDIAMRTPTIRPMPMAFALTNAPVYFECRGGGLFPVERAAIAEQVRVARSQVGGPGDPQEDALQRIMQLDLGDANYRVDNRFLMMGIVALRPRDGATGLSPERELPPRLAALDPARDFVVLLVRDDSFPLFRRVRDAAARAGLEVGWEYLARDEPITFEGSMARIMAQ